jgi:hypothetical protein
MLFGLETAFYAFIGLSVFAVGEVGKHSGAALLV